MAHFAEIDENNIVLRVCAVDDAHEDDGENWCKDFWGGRWKQTSYNHRIRYNYAGIGYTYDAVNDAFIAPKTFPSWELDSNFRWQAPVEYPDDGNVYKWDEDNRSWVKFETD